MLSPPTKFDFFLNLNHQDFVLATSKVLERDRHGVLTLMMNHFKKGLAMESFTDKQCSYSLIVMKVMGKANHIFSL